MVKQSEEGDRDTRATVASTATASRKHFHRAPAVATPNSQLVLSPYARPPCYFTNLHFGKGQDAHLPRHKTQ